MDPGFNQDGSKVLGPTLFTCQSVHGVLEGQGSSMDCPIYIIFFRWSAVLPSRDECWPLLLEEKSPTNQAHKERCPLTEGSELESLECRRYSHVQCTAGSELECLRYNHVVITRE